MPARVSSFWPEVRPVSIAIVAEAPGDVEVARGQPLVGPSGRVLSKGLHDAGIDRSRCFITNVFDFHLPRNNVKPLTQPRAAVRGTYKTFQEWESVPICSGGYLPYEYALEHLDRLQKELQEANPTVIIALGGTALWALLALPGSGSIGRLRGAVQFGPLVEAKVLPTFHPAFILRSWQNYPIFWADLKKAARQSTSRDYHPVEYPIHPVPTTPAEVAYLLHNLKPPVAVDIETSRGCIDCIGFSDLSTTFTVPIFDKVTLRHYWSLPDEIVVRRLLTRWLESPVPKVFQNGNYDVQWLYERWGVLTRGYEHDTRLLHHALYPELPKDLGTMAALHLELPSWKPIKGAGGTKRED